MAVLTDNSFIGPVLSGLAQHSEGISWIFKDGEVVLIDWQRPVSQTIAHEVGVSTPVFQLLSRSLPAHPQMPASDSLPSWNDRPSERIAVHDHDGRLWPENPLPFQAAFAIDSSAAAPRSA